MLTQPHPETAPRTHPPKLTTYSKARYTTSQHLTEAKELFELLTPCDEDFTPTEATRGSRPKLPIRKHRGHRARMVQAPNHQRVCAPCLHHHNALEMPHPRQDSVNQFAEHDDTVPVCS